MKDLNIKKSIELEIDHIQDGIKFNLLLFSQGKYDRNKLRTIIRNTGVKLVITNELSKEVELKNIYFGIFNQNKLTKLFSSNKLFDSLPITLLPGQTAFFYFYGWQIKEKLQEFKNEEGMFLFSSDLPIKYVKSSKFNGDKIEKILVDLEEEEIANLGDIIFNPLDIEVVN